jgi:uncharacterized protein YjbI with pentapeptide repeats
MFRKRALNLIKMLVPDWRPTAAQVLWAIRIAIGLTVLLGIFALVGDQYGKTIWDSAQLLLTASIPVVIAIVGNRFTQQRAQDDALQGYLDQMSQLLSDEERPLHRAQPGDSLITAARARTLTVLTRLDGRRKGTVLKFLFESGLIYKHHSRLNESGLIESQNPIVILAQAELSGAELSGATLIGAYLGEVDLSGADLSWASLFKAVLGGANLSKANLSEAWLANAVLPGANLSGANLSGAGLAEAILGGANLTRANLSGADLTHANLAGFDPFPSGDDVFGANLSGANLSGANLSGANLSGVKGIPEEELLTQQAQSLEGATMPNGQKYEDWLNNEASRVEEEP